VDDQTNKTARVPRPRTLTSWNITKKGSGETFDPDRWRPTRPDANRRCSLFSFKRVNHTGGPLGTVSK